MITQAYSLRISGKSQTFHEELKVIAAGEKKMVVGDCWVVFQLQLIFNLILDSGVQHSGYITYEMIPPISLAPT